MNQNSSPKISVIVPVYKVEKYLRACIDSILAQTFTDFELILVDDGSPDNCGAICDEYARRLGGEIEIIGNAEPLVRVPANEPQMPHIRVFHKENGGVSSARNLGIERSRGEWIAFVDSDDMVSPHYLANLYGNGPEKDCLVFLGMKRVTEAGKITGYLRFVPATMSVKQAFAEKTLENWGYPVSKLYNREIIMRKRVRFDEQIKMAEDTCFMFSYLEHASAIVFRDYCKDYIYITHPGSASFKHYDFESEWKLYLLSREAMQKFRGKTAFPIFAFWRSVAVLYRPYSGLNRSKRLKILSTCFAEGKKCGAGFVGRTWREKIFAAGHIKTFDFVESILFGLRYGVLNFAWQFYVKLKNQMNNKIKISGGG